MTIPLLDAIALQGKTITADALLTQRKLANQVLNREADYHFTVKHISPRYARILPSSSRIGKNRILSTTPHPITDASKPEKSGQPRCLTITWIFPTSAKPS
jgi:predicted transposase YbfD/YdcC